MAIYIHAQLQEHTAVEVVYTYEDGVESGRIRVPKDDPSAFSLEEGSQFSAVPVVVKAARLFREEGEWPQEVIVAS